MPQCYIRNVKCCTPVFFISITERIAVMAFWIKKSAAVLELEAIVLEIQSNLENNYKDAAQSAREKLKIRLEELNSEGKLKEKDYKRFGVIYTEYSVKMTGYHH